VNAINDIWNTICESAGVKGKTPHSARHGMGRHLIEKTGNVEAVQRQLGHKNAAYSLQYSRITREELNSALDDRE
jgi:integrase